MSVDDLRIGMEVELVVDTLLTETAEDGTHRRADRVEMEPGGFRDAGRRGGRMSNDRRVAVMGAGMHPWGKWGRNFVEYGVVAARAALADAGIAWSDVQFVAGADTIRNGYPGLRLGHDLRAGAGLDRGERVEFVRRLRQWGSCHRERAGADPRRAV